MKHYIKLWAAAFALIFLTAGFLGAQELKIPSPTNLFQHSVSSGAIYEFPTVRIWGWSAEGKIAYSIEREMAGVGGKIIEFNVFDAVEDDVVSNFNIDSYDIDRVSITNALRANNIVEGEIGFQPFPIRRNNMEYLCSLTNVAYSPDSYGFFNDNISKYSVVVTANGKSKTVNTFSGGNLTRKVYICGYILSPFENRALLVLAEERFVFEGTELFYVFCGCHLGVGF